MPDPIGRAWLVDEIRHPAITAVDVAILTPKSRSLGVYLTQVLNSDEYLAHADNVATGTTRKRISRSVLGRTHVLIPTNSLLEQFESDTAAARLLVTNLRASTARLQLIRDLLLPKLIAGQIDLSSLTLDALVETAAT